jgi:hypothetical protein
MHISKKMDIQSMSQQDAQKYLAQRYQDIVENHLVKIPVENIESLMGLLQQYGLKQMANELSTHLQYRNKNLTVFDVVYIYQGPAKGQVIIYTGGVDCLNSNSGQIESLPVEDWLVPYGIYSKGQVLSVLPPKAIRVHEFFGNIVETEVAA